MQDSLSNNSEKVYMVQEELIGLVRFAAKLEADGYSEDSDYVLNETVRLAGWLGELAGGVAENAGKFKQFLSPAREYGENFLKNIDTAKTFANPDAASALTNATSTLTNSDAPALLQFVQKYLPGQTGTVTKLVQDSSALAEEIANPSANPFSSFRSEFAKELEARGLTGTPEATDPNFYKQFLENKQTVISNQLSSLKNDIVANQSNAIKKSVLDSNNGAFQNQYSLNGLNTAKGGALGYLGYNQIKNQFNQPKAPGDTATTSTTPTAQALDPNSKLFATN